tara:strand:- start:289 stop:1830 length:1542 start_codon:yes stop_codon:yes gene_type:complete
MKLLTKITLSLALLMPSAAFAALDTTHADYAGTVDENFIESGPASEGLSMVNFLMCVMANSNSGNHVNETYASIIDENRCNGVVGSKTPNFSQQTMTTSRISNTAPYTMKSWFTTSDRQTIVVESSITSAPTDALPRGVFTMNWNMLASTSDATVIAKGILNAKSDNTIEYIEEMPNVDQSPPTMMYSYVHGTLNGASGGNLRVKTQVYAGDDHTDTVYRYVFDASDVHYATWDGTSDTDTVCLDRTPANMLKYTRNYNMFTEDGALVTFTNLEPFNFTYTSTVDGKTKRGYADKWSAWLEGFDLEADKPLTITRESDGQAYSVCWDDNDDGSGSCGAGGDDVRWHLNIAGTAKPFADPIDLTARTIVGSDMTTVVTAVNAWGYNGGNGFGQYHGSGSGLGIIEECLLGTTWTTRLGNNCDNARKFRPKYNIADGTEFTLKSDGTTKYFIKASDSYRDLAIQATSVCTNNSLLALSGAPAALGSYEISEAPAANLLWGDKPAAILKVIHGVEQ